MRETNQGILQLVERFSREARAAVRLRSDHVARVLDVGTLDTGSPYIVMEYLEGQDLGSMVESGGPLPVAAAVDCVLQACDAVAEAHALGIVHRDLKPRNLFLTERNDGRALVKVLDFGISKHKTAGGDLSLTRTAEVMGSPNYMSPEQLKSAKALFVSDAGSPMEVASDGQLVFFTQSGDGTMRRIGVDGGGLASFPSGSTSDAFGLALDSTSVYWGLFDPSGTLYGMAKSGTMPKTLASSQVLPGPVTSDGTNLYWADFGAGPTDGTVYTCPISACSSPTMLANNQPFPRTVLVDATAVYWNDNGTNGSDGTIMKLAR